MSGAAITADATLTGGGTRLGIPITLNANFGHGTGNSNFSGKYVSPPAGASTGNGNAVFLGENNDIYVAGSYTGASGNKPMAVTKFDVTGALNTDFDTDGTKTIAFDSGTDVANKVLYIVDNGGELLVAGTCASGWAIAKLNPTTGAMITSFGPNGTGMRSGFQVGTLYAMDYHTAGVGEQTGRIALAGTDGSGHMMVYELDVATGATIWSRSITFDETLYSFQVGFAVVVQVDDNKVVVAGQACRSTAPFGSDFALARLNNDGTFDTSFDVDGKLTTNFCELTTSNDAAYSIVESTDHTCLYAVGKTDYDGSDRFAVVSYLESNGSGNPNFKNNGLANGVAVGPRGIAYDAGTRSADGSGMLVVGGAGTPGDTSSDFVVARFKTEQSEGAGNVGGALDSNFGSGGVATTDFLKSGTYNSGYDVCKGIAFTTGLNTDHIGILAVGYSGTNAVGGNIAMAEYLPKNRIIVHSPIGPGAPLMAASSSGATASDPPAGTTELVLLNGGRRDDDVLSSA